MGNFDKKIAKFIEIFIDQNGYVKVLEGLQNTLVIAILGLIIGIAAGGLGGLILLAGILVLVVVLLKKKR